jgi:hypothetical protein
VLLRACHQPLVDVLLHPGGVTVVELEQERLRRLDVGFRREVRGEDVVIAADETDGLAVALGDQPGRRVGRGQAEILEREAQQAWVPHAGLDLDGRVGTSTTFRVRRRRGQGEWEQDDRDAHSCDRTPR